ncbi:MAG TPA: sulfotransferase, partial [Actinopolymorphaceae bacterium]
MRIVVQDSRPVFRRASRFARNTVVQTIESLPLCGLLDPADPTRPLRRVVVVTGPHRSGTTIMGRLLLHASRTFLVHEPFNVDWGLDGGDHRYPYLSSTDVDDRRALALRRYLTTGEATWRGNGAVLGRQHPRVVRNRRNVRGLRPFGYTAIVKDPFLLLSLGWVDAALTSRPPVVTLRHPGAWVASLKRRTMHPRAALESFRAQDAYGDPVVAEILARRNWESADLVDAGAATWACLVRMLDVQLDAGARATVVRMEDFAAEPVTVMRRVYAACGLTPPRRFAQIVDEYTGDQNIVVPDRPVLHALRRNSAALANAWRERLTDEEQRTI